MTFSTWPDTCEFEEIAYLLVHEKLPTLNELAAYKEKLRSLRDLPAGVKTILEAIPATAHPMDVMRTGVSALGTILPEAEKHTIEGARDLADRLLACLGSILLYWHHYSHNNRRIELAADEDSIGGHFLHLLHGRPPSPSWVKAMHTSLVLYAEHEFNASTFAARVIAGTGSDFYSAITGAIGALRGPKHGGANEAAFDIQTRYESPDEAEADIRRRVANKEIIIGFGHPVYTTGDPRNRIIREVARKLSVEAGDTEMFEYCGETGNSNVGYQENVPQSRLVLRRELSHDGCTHSHVHATVCDRAHQRLGGAHHRTTSGQQDYPAIGKLHRAGGAGVCADFGTDIRIADYIGTPRFEQLSVSSIF